MPLEEDERPLEKGCRARLLLVGQDFGVGKPGGVVDGDVESFPAETLATRPTIALAFAIAGDAVTDAVDPAKLLGIDMDQLAGPVALVADDGSGWLQGLETAKPQPAQGFAHRRDRPAEPPCNRRPRQTLAPQGFDLGLGCCVEP